MHGPNFAPCRINETGVKLNQFGSINVSVLICSNLIKTNQFGLVLGLNKTNLTEGCPPTMWRLLI